MKNYKITNTESYESIKLGIDAHAKWYYVARQLDGATPQPVQKMDFEGLLHFVARQKRMAREVHTCYEAGAFGYHLHHRLTALGQWANASIKRAAPQAKPTARHGAKARARKACFSSSIFYLRSSIYHPRSLLSGITASAWLPRGRTACHRLVRRRPGLRSPSQHRPPRRRASGWRLHPRSNLIDSCCNRPCR